MSLTVYLEEENVAKFKCDCSSCVATSKQIVFYNSISDSFIELAHACDLYYKIWQPKTLGIYYARDLIEHLRKGIKKLDVKREYLKPLVPENKKYIDFVKFCIKYGKACIDYPNSKIYVKENSKIENTHINFNADSSIKISKAYDELNITNLIYSQDFDLKSLIKILNWLVEDGYTEIYLDLTNKNSVFVRKLYP